MAHSILIIADSGAGKSTSIEKLNSDETFIINVANKIYSKDDFKIKQEFLNNLNEYFQSEIESLDFSNAAQSAETINNRVANNTNNKINNIIDKNSLSSLTKLILINTIYFNGK